MSEEFGKLQLAADPQEESPIGKGIKAAVIIIGIILLLTVFRPWVTVGPGERGIVTHFGQVQKDVLGEGIHGRIPIYEKVSYMDVKVQKEEVGADAVSKDLQTVTTKMALNYHVSPDAVARLFQNVGFEFPTRIIAPVIQESMKATTAKYTAEELVSKREDVAREVRQRIASKLQPYGIFVDGLNITNFDFSREFNAAIEQKQVAEQRALKAKRDLERIKIEAEQKVATAQAEAQAFKLKSQQLTPLMVEMEKIKKWDGHYPTTMVTSGEGIMPIINLDK